MEPVMLWLYRCLSLGLFRFFGITLWFVDGFKSLREFLNRLRIRHGKYLKTLRIPLGKFWNVLEFSQVIIITFPHMQRRKKIRARGKNVNISVDSFPFFSFLFLQTWSFEDFPDPPPLPGVRRACESQPESCRFPRTGQVIHFSRKWTEKTAEQRDGGNFERFS